jgi:PIN domain nuclease of toxin-antitoxin system
MPESPLYLMDTCVWLWLMREDTKNIKPQTAAMLAEAAKQSCLMLSLISCWEIALLTSKNRIQLGMPCEHWINEALALPGLQRGRLTPSVLIESCHLPGQFHADPADRMIVATARLHQAILVTADQHMIAYGKQGHVNVLAV